MWVSSWGALLTAPDALRAKMGGAFRAVVGADFSDCLVCVGAKVLRQKGNEFVCCEATRKINEDSRGRSCSQSWEDSGDG